MSRTICIANQKGGVGKTTTAVNLADALAKSGSRCVLVDLDPQCNATSAFGHRPQEEHPLLAGEPLSQAALRTDNSSLFVIPGSRKFRDAERLNEAKERATLLKRLNSASALFDYVLLDCPPSLGTLTQTALMASTEVLMPIQCEYFAMEGLTQMIEVIRDVMQADPGKLEFGGILLTMYDPTLELTHEIDSEVRDFFGEIVFDVVIPRDVAVAEAPSHGKSVLDYAPRSRGTRAFLELCREVIDRE